MSINDEVILKKCLVWVFPQKVRASQFTLWISQSAEFCRVTVLGLKHIIWPISNVYQVSLNSIFAENGPTTEKHTFKLDLNVNSS